MSLSHRFRARALALPALLAGATCAVVGPAALAQDEDGNGRLLSLGLSLGLDVSDRQGSGVDGTTTQARGGLTFGLATETATDRLTLDGSMDLRLVLGPGTDGTEFLPGDPRIALGYDRLGARSGLSVNLSYRQSDIAFLRPLSDFLNDDGTIDLPDDLADLTGEGQRRALGFGARLSLRDDAPLGITLSVNRDGLSYQDVTSPDLLDNSRTRAGLSFRLDINPVLTANIGLSQTRFAQDGAADRDTRSLSAGLTLTRPNGELHFSVDADDTPEGTRTSLSLGRSFERPGGGGLDLSLGFSRGVTGGTSLNGALSFQQDYALGSVNASLRQSLAAGSDDTERLVTALNLGLSHELGDVGSLSLSAAWARTTDTAQDTRVDQTGFSIALSRPLTADWSLNLGLRHDSRQADGAARTTDNAIFLTLGRSFALPF